MPLRYDPTILIFILVAFILWEIQAQSYHNGFSGHGSLNPHAKQATIPKDAMIDKLKGMLFLGALGDGLGCPTEQTCQSGAIYSNYSCGLQAYKPTSYHGSEWGVWPNQTEIKGTFGVVTDDTSFRISLFEPWLLSNCSNNINNCHFCDINNEKNIIPKKTFNELNESLFKLFINETDSILYASLNELNSVSTKREEMLADFVVIMNDANVKPIINNITHGNNPFYIVGLPVVFGSYMYIEIGALICNVYSIYNLTQWNFISNYTKLDTNYGHIYTGLLISLLADALNTNIAHNENDANSFGSWIFETINKYYSWFDIIYSNNSNSLSVEYKLLQNISNSSYNIGYNEWNLEKHLNISQFILESEKEYLYFENIENRELYSEDPRVFWRQEWLTIGFCNNNQFLTNISDVACMLSTLMACAGDSDTVGSELALIIGAYYGYDYISKLSCHVSNDEGQTCQTFKQQFDYIDSFLNQWYQYNITQQATLFYHRNQEFTG